jgi:hypothetical protein
VSVSEQGKFLKRKAQANKNIIVSSQANQMIKKEENKNLYIFCNKYDRKSNYNIYILISTKNGIYYLLYCV